MFRHDVLLYAEDDPTFAEILEHTFKQGGFAHHLIRVADGEQAIAYLKGEGAYSDREQYPLPGLLLLDLKMPRVNGLDVLEWIRNKSECPHLPVVVLTVSEELRDINKAYQLGANSFLIKPPKVSELRGTLKMIDTYWFKLNVTESWKEQGGRLTSK
jgi:CheY-like chemotaxis protein